MLQDDCQRFSSLLWSLLRPTTAGTYFQKMGLNVIEAAATAVSPVNLAMRGKREGGRTDSSGCPATSRRAPTATKSSRMTLSWPSFGRKGREKGAMVGMAMAWWMGGRRAGGASDGRASDGRASNRQVFSIVRWDRRGWAPRPPRERARWHAVVLMGRHVAMMPQLLLLCMLDWEAESEMCCAYMCCWLLASCHHGVSLGVPAAAACWLCKPDRQDCIIKRALLAPSSACVRNRSTHG